MIKEAVWPETLILKARAKVSKSENENKLTDALITGVTWADLKMQGTRLHTNMFNIVVCYVGRSLEFVDIVNKFFLSEWLQS